jgi:hypothetical protein
MIRDKFTELAIGAIFGSEVDVHKEVLKNFL